MQEGLHLAKGQQGWLLGCRFGEVHHHADMRTYVLSLMVYPLSLEFCHPCTSLFTLAWEEIGIEYSQIAAVLVVHLVCFHVGMVYGYVLVFLEGDSVEFSCQTEHAVDHLVKLQVGAQHLGVEVVFLHLQLVRVETHVPGFHHEVISLNAFC